MATFPSIEPDTRSFDLGDFATSTAQGINGTEVRFNHGDEATGHDLTLTFLDRSEAELTSIRAHYLGQNGGQVSFRFPAIIWQGHSTTSDVVPIEGRWKYAGAPEETHKNGRIHGVTVRAQYVGRSLTA